MATFSLKDSLNKINNPSADGIFEYGYYDATNTVFTPFNTYGYTDGSPTPANPPYVNDKILGWYEAGNPDTDVAISFEFDSINGNLSITPQPFPSTGIYMHPSGGPGAAGVKNIAIRMHLPSAGTLSATGTIQAATTGGCGDDIGYRMRQNMATDIMPRANLPKSASTTPINLADTPVALGDVIDFIIDIGDDGTFFCDDTALDINYTVTLAQVPTPVLQGTLTCNSTTAVYDLSLQNEGTVELYQVGNPVPIATTSVVAAGYNGVATFTGLNLLAGGEYYTIGKNAGQLDSAESTHVIITSCYTADAVDDAVGVKATGVATTTDVSTNDVLCNLGTTTFALVASSEINVGAVSFTGSTATYTPTADGAFSFQYNILCDGNIIDTATVSGTACSAPVITVQPVDASICTGGSTILSVTATGTATLTYQWRESGVDIPTATASTFTATAAGSYTVVVTNSCGSVTSNPAVVTENTPPVITSGGTLPDGQNGSAYTASVVYSGTLPLAIANIVAPAWMTITLTGNTVNITGTPTAGDVGTNIPVSWDISNACATVPFADTIDVTIGCINVTGGTITGPSPVVVGAGNNYTVSGLSGTAPFTYNWSATNGTVTAGQGTDTATISFTADGVISVVITNCAGAGTVTPTLPVVVFTADAVDDAVGNKIIGTADTVDISTNDVVCNAGVTTFALVAGSETNVTVNSLTGSIANYTPTAAGPFSFQYNILCDGNIIDTATVSGTGITACVPPAVTVQPTGATICSPATHSMTVTSSGTAPLAYQWRLDGVDIVGATTDTHVTGTAGSYDVVITNACGTVTSNAAVVVVNTPVSILTGATLPDGLVGSAYNHTITLAGSPTITIANQVKPAWMTIAIAGTTITFSGTPTAGDVGTAIPVSFDITNPCNTVPFSDTIDVSASCVNVTGGTITGPTSVIAGASNAYMVNGHTGTGPFTYNWTVTNGTVVSGQGTDMVQISMTANSTVSVTITNCAGAGTVTPTLAVTIITADAVDDDAGPKITGTATTTDVTPNDVVCSSGVTTYTLVAGTGTNVTGLTLSTAGLASYTPTADGAFSFQYELRCDGVVLDTATVSGIASTGCTNIAGGTISGPSMVLANAANNFTVTGFTGTLPYTFAWTVTNGTINSGQGTDTVSVTFTSAGTLSLTSTNCGGAGTVSLNFPVTITAITADAVNDAVGNKTTGISTTTDVTTNDTVCSSGITTYTLVTGTGTNVSGLSMTTAGVATYTPVADGAFSFQYEIRCDGTVLDTATVSGTAVSACTPVGSGNITGNMNPVSGATEVYTVSGLTGTAPYTYNWTVVDGIILSGQGTDTLTVQWI